MRNKTPLQKLHEIIYAEKTEKHKVVMSTKAILIEIAKLYADEREFAGDCFDAGFEHAIDANGGLQNFETFYKAYEK